MTSTGFEPSWQWPQDLPGGWAEDVNINDATTNPERNSDQWSGPNADNQANPMSDGTNDTNQGTESVPPTDNDTPQANPDAQNGRFYRPRMCRICFDTVLPTFHPPSDDVPGLFQSPPTVTYESPEDGRLIRPCLCKGSQKYVHENCLTQWRLQNPLEKRNYWQCPTCNYKYRLERMAWGRWISSTCKFYQVPLSINFSF